MVLEVSTEAVLLLRQALSLATCALAMEAGADRTSLDSELGGLLLAPSLQVNQLNSVASHTGICAGSC